MIVIQEDNTLAVSEDFLPHGAAVSEPSSLDNQPIEALDLHIGFGNRTRPTVACALCPHRYGGPRRRIRRSSHRAGVASTDRRAEVAAHAHDLRGL